MYVKEPPGEYTIEYARWADHTMYLVTHEDKHPYILAHYQVEHCTQPEQCRSAVKDKKTYYQVEDLQHVDECSLNPAVEGKEVVLKFGDKHHEVEVSSDS